MTVKELIVLIGNRAIINIHRKDGTNLYLSQCSEEYNQSKIEDYFDRDIAKIEIANSVDKYDGIIRIFVEDEEVQIVKGDKINMNTVTNKCPICGKCSMSASNQYCSEHKHLGQNTFAEKLDNVINGPIKSYTKEEAYECLQKLGILDEVGEITPAFQDIIVREDNEVK